MLVQSVGWRHFMFYVLLAKVLRKPAGRLGKVVFRERSEYRGCGELDEVAVESTVGW